MDLRRIVVLFVAPVAIVAGSVTVSRFCRAPLASHLSANEVESFPVESGILNSDLPVPPELQSRCFSQAAKLRLQLGEDCQVAVFSPFVVAGDLTQEELHRWYRRTILPASRAMNAEYFTHPPTVPLQLLLFRNADSYNDHCLQLFGDRFVSVYGYYKPDQHTLVVNLATGSGSLVHELTHALMHSDFPQAPPWLQEGLASLHEQAGFSRVDGQMVLRGRLNWRLHRLQEAIGRGQLEPIEQLLAAQTLLGAEEPIQYARARYLCLFLQERQQLAPFYEHFRSQFQQDPTGRGALETVLGARGFESLNHDFVRWVAELSPEDR